VRDRPAGEFWFAVAGGATIVLAIATVVASHAKPAWLDWLWKMLTSIV
jgi:hypothetical protein